MIQRKFKMLYLKLALPAMAIAMVIPAQALDVTFSTTGAFNCHAAANCTVSGGGDVVTYGSGANTLTLTFDPTATSTQDLEPNPPFEPLPTTNASGGDIIASITGDGSTITGGTFSLNIDQSAGGGINAGTGSFLANLGGSIHANNSSGVAQFVGSGGIIVGGGATLAVGNVQYDLQEQTHTDGNGAPGYDLEDPVQNHGDTSLQMELTALNPTPEPSFLALTGIGFLGMGIFAFRRRRSA
jgi:hypothetical protein